MNGEVFWVLRMLVWLEVAIGIVVAVLAVALAFRLVLRAEERRLRVKRKGRLASPSGEDPNSGYSTGGGSGYEGGHGGSVGGD
jgi:hypothetical protein